MTDPEVNGRSRPMDDESDEDASEAQAQVIESLRAQVTDLFSQVTQLNGKLVASYDRVSDLEDQLHDASGSLRNASVTISSLELERSHHLAALNTGLLVEKAHVTAELNRLMERATEEAAQRGQAETARRDIEKDLDDLSASLFDQANIMVAEARFNQAKSERKVQDAEIALKIAEDAVQDMQIQMQALQAEKEVAERDAREAKVTMGKGKWVEHADARIGEVPRIRFMTTHTPFAEFIAFVTHLRGMRASQLAPPVVSTLLNQPFIARLLNEDSEPTVRLDLAPSLNWLSRRSVLAAIHTGMLTVEPVAFSSLVQELHQHPQLMATSLSCALCGTLITRLTSSPVSRTHSTNGSSWFKYPLALGSPQNHNTRTFQSAECEPPGQVYIFRLAATTATTLSPVLTPSHASSVSMSAVGTSRPLNVISSSRVIQTQAQNSPYPLCTSNYCLTRLRSTCSLWAFVRVGVVERIWEEEVDQSTKPLVNGDTQGTPSPLTAPGTGNQPETNATFPSGSDKPPIPPRRRRLWEMASVFGERAVGWGKESGENTREKERQGKKSIPPPPPSHPSAPHPHAELLTSRVDIQEPPPLPKRNAIRGNATTDTVVPQSGVQNGAVASETKEYTAALNGHLDPDKAECNASESPSTSLDEITFATPPPEPSASPSRTSNPASIEHDEYPPPPSPHTVPLPVTPTTPVPIAHVVPPVSRPRSRLSTRASPPPSSRPASPAINRSRAGSPTPAGIARATSPSPGHIPSAPHVRGKITTSSPLGPSSRSGSPIPASGPGVPPLPRRAAARRAVPPPPTSMGLKTVEKGGREEAVASSIEAVATADPVPEADARKASEIPVETEGSTAEGSERADAVKEMAISTDAALEPPKAITGDNVEGVANGVRPSVPEGDGCASVETASTKQSSVLEGGFASDVTWEERTWKELIKLKEDMFWARIGGVRTLR